MMAMARVLYRRVLADPQGQGQESQNGRQGRHGDRPQAVFPLPGSGLWADQARLVRRDKRGEHEISSRRPTAASPLKELLCALTAILSNTNFIVKVNKLVNN